VPIDRLGVETEFFGQRAAARAVTAIGRDNQKIDPPALLVRAYRAAECSSTSQLAAASTHTDFIAESAQSQPFLLV